MSSLLTRYFSILLCLTVLFGCSPIVSIVPEDDDSPLAITKSSVADLGRDSLFYYTDEACWIKPQADPYKFIYFQTAATQYFSECKTTSLKNSEISPTHYALIVYPKSESEVNRIMNIDGIKISYIPFGYSPVSDDEVPISLKTNASQLEFRKHTNSTTNMPVMYVVWPINISIPDDIDFHIEYDAFIPDYTNLNEYEFEELLCIEKRAIEIATSNESGECSRGQSYRTLHALIKNNDNLLGSPVPVGNLKIRVQYGLNIIDNYTQQDGSVTISGNINDNASVYIVYENDRWRISRKGSLFAYSLLLGKLTDIWPYNSFVYSQTQTHNYLTIHRAANYFFHDNPFLSAPQTNYSIRINMSEVVAADSYFTFVLGSPKIEISDFWANNSGYYFSTAIHELGHFYHYLQKGSNYSSYDSVHKLIKESFAEFVTWCLSRYYYTQLNGGVYNTSWDNPLHGLRQIWLPTDSSYYSPLFIDLMDDYNQYEERPPIHTYNNDQISDMPFMAITNIAVQNNNWDSVKNALLSKVGIYFTFSEYNTYIAPYNTYFSSN